MHFELSYFEGEEKEGFYITSMMKRAWAATLEVLNQVDVICAKHGIEYFADWGTLLGAIRHGGYIPWDDDIDICMKRKDYVRFLSIARYELPSEYRVVTYADSEIWELPLARVVNTVEVPLPNERLEEFHNFPYMVGIDIFPLDYIPNDKTEENTLLDLFRITYSSGINWNEELGGYEERMERLRLVEELCGVEFVDDKPYHQQLLILSDKTASMYWDTGKEAKELTMMYELMKNEKFRIPVSCYDSYVRIPFENTTIPIPIGYEEILTLYYGENYMTPIRGTADHEYPFYKKQQKMLLEYYEKKGMVMPEYLREK